MWGLSSRNAEGILSRRPGLTCLSCLKFLPAVLLAVVIVLCLYGVSQHLLAEVHAVENHEMVEPAGNVGAEKERTATEESSVMVLAMKKIEDSPGENRSFEGSGGVPLHASHDPALGGVGERFASLTTSAQDPSIQFGDKNSPYADTEENGGDVVVLPQISSVPGITFVNTMIGLLDHEINGRFLGWRPNDLIIGRFTDNVNNFQLGVLEAVRFTALRLKDSLTRMGDGDSYDPDLEEASSLLMNRATQFWFPSAESSYSGALKHLDRFLDKLDDGQKNFYYRKDTLLALISAYKDLLGNVNKTLVDPSVSWFETDNHFYYAKGVAHVLYEMLKVVRVGFQNQLESTPYGIEVMDKILHELHRVEGMTPWIVMNSSLDGFFANHRANINAPLSEVLNLMTLMGQL